MRHRQESSDPLAETLRRTIAANRPNLCRLSQVSGVSRGTIYHLIRDSHALRQPSLRRIAAGLQVVLQKTEDPRPNSSLEYLEREIAYATSFDTRTARQRAQTIAQQMCERVTAIKDLPYVQEQVAANLRATVRRAVGDEAAAAQLGLSRVALELGDYDLTLRLASAVPTSDRQRYYVARWLTAEALRMLGRWPEARAAARMALRSRDPVVRAWAHWNTGKIEDKLGRYRVAAEAYQSAMRLAASHGIPDWESRDVRAWSLWALGWAAMRTGTPAEALARFQQAAVTAPEGDAGVQLWVAHGLGQLLVAIGELDEAREVFEASLRLADALGNKHYTGWMYNGLAEIALVQGAYAAASSWAARAATVYEKYAGPDAPSRALALAIDQFAQAASGECSWGVAADSLDHLARRTESYRLAHCTVGLLACEARRQEGELAVAGRQAAVLVDLGRSSGLALETAYAHLAVATIALQRSFVAGPSRASERRAGITALRRARRTFEARQAQWGIVRCAMLARAAGVAVDAKRIHDIARGRFPLESAELGLCRPGLIPRTPLAFIGD